MRRRGTALAYPRPEELQNAASGELVVSRDGLSLEHHNNSRSSLRIGSGSIRSAAFYGDAIELRIGAGKRILIGCDDIELLDVLFQANF